MIRVAHRRCGAPKSGMVEDFDVAEFHHGGHHLDRADEDGSVVADDVGTTYLGKVVNDAAATDSFVREEEG